MIYHGGEPIWRQVAEVKMTMIKFSDSYLDGYLNRHWDDVQHCVGCYMFEREGIRLFQKIEGDYFAILGLPLLPLIDFLRLREVIEV